MNEIPEVETILVNGWREYPINKIIDTHDRSFFQKFGEYHIELRLWDHTKFGKNYKIGWDLDGRLGKLCLQISTNMQTLEQDVQEMLSLLGKYSELNPAESE